MMVRLLDLLSGCEDELVCEATLLYNLRHMGVIGRCKQRPIAAALYASTCFVALYQCVQLTSS